MVTLFIDQKMYSKSNDFQVSLNIYRYYFKPLKFLII